MARAALASRTRLLVFSTLTVATLLGTSDAEAQRRRRRRNNQQTTTQTATETPEPAEAPASATGATTPATTPATTTTTTAATTTTASTAPAVSAAPPVDTVSSEPQPAPVRSEPAVLVVPIERPRPAAIDAHLGIAMVGRSFWYTDDLFMQLRPYSLAIAPAVNGGVEWYPGAHFSRGVASMFGLVADGQFTMLFGSSDSQGRTYPTLAYNFNAGARVRLWLLDRIDAGVVLGFSMQNFTLDRSAVMLAPAEGIANTTYAGLRAGLTARAQIVERFAITAGSTWQYVLSAGEITTRDWFQRATVMGVDFSLGGAFAITKGLEVRLRADWRRYFYAMNPQPGDPLIAGGAVDDNYGLTASIAVRR